MLLAHYFIERCTDGTFVDRKFHVPNQASVELAPGFSFLDTKYGNLRLFRPILSAASGGPPLEDRPAVLLSPDPPNTIEMQMPLIEKLAVKYNVVSFEVPGAPVFVPPSYNYLKVLSIFLGFGFSSVGSAYKFDTETLAQLIIHLIEVLKLKGPVAKAPVVSALTCVSGLAQLRAAQLRPDLITHLVFGQTATYSDQRAWAYRMSKGALSVPLLGQLLMKFSSAKVAEGWYKVALPRDMPEPQQQGQFVKPAVQSIHRGAAFTLASALQSLLRPPTEEEKRRPVTSYYSPLKQRVVILFGAKDRTHRPTMKDGMALHFEKENTTYCELANCAHFPDLEYGLRFSEFRQWR